MLLPDYDKYFFLLKENLLASTNPKAKELLDKLAAIHDSLDDLQQSTEEILDIVIFNSN